MLVNAEIHVLDVPGQLVKSLEPISLAGGNIVGVVHNRDRVIDGRIGVSITFSIDANGLERVKKAWDSNDVVTARVDSVIETYSMDYMIIGKISSSDAERMISDSQVPIHSVNVRSSSSAGNDIHTIMVSAMLRSEEGVKALDKYVGDACKKSKAAYIRGLS